MTEYEKQAVDFLAKHGITFNAEEGTGKEPSWGGVHGIQYVIKMMKKNPRKQLTFDFWDSYQDMLDGNEPNAYDVLACISGDSSYITTEEVFREFGYDDMTEEQAASIAAFGRKLNKFFTPEELTDLQEIQ